MADKTLIQRLYLIAKGDEGLSAGDQRFARDLIEGKYGYNKRGYLTERQQAAALKMIQRADSSADQQANPDTTPKLSAVYAFLQAAREHLKYPKLMLAMGDHTLKVYLSGSMSKHPNTVNLVTNNEYGEMDVWLGRVFETGEWQHWNKNPELHKEAAQLLERLAVDPAAVAAESGRLSGNCCMCNRALKDERSTDVGYGPTCAKRWGLPWGKK